MQGNQDCLATLSATSIHSTSTEVHPFYCDRLRTKQLGLTRANGRRIVLKRRSYEALQLCDYVCLSIRFGSECVRPGKTGERGKRQTQGKGGKRRKTSQEIRFARSRPEDRG